VGELTQKIADGDLSVEIKTHASDQASILHSITDCP